VRLLRDGIPASPGIVIGAAKVLRWETPAAPHGGIAPDRVEAEVGRFQAACDAVKAQIRVVQERTRDRLGTVEAQIFEPQLLMLEDADLVGGTIANIRENLLPAERAFEWRVLEWEAQWAHTAHPMVLDKLSDLADIQGRVLRHLMSLPEPGVSFVAESERAILVARDLTPSITVQLDPERIVGIALDGGTRASHSAILARSMHIPCVVSLGDLSETLQSGVEMILDGRSGRVIAAPTDAEKAAYRDRDFQIREWEQELMLLSHLDAVTRDGRRIALNANIDLPGEAAGALAHGAEGIGLFRTEFLVVGRSSMPGEDDQVQAYRQVAAVFPDAPVVIRTYDLGGDKFPAFLHIPAEENPYLGWRAIRLCLDEPKLFRTQLRAILRAAPAGDVRIMLPLVNDIAEVTATRALLEECREELAREGEAVPEHVAVGAMIETPAAVLTAADLAPHVDFFSVGTNDLVQYTLAVDRGNSRLASRYNPFHPGVVRLLAHVARVGRETGRSVSVCGEFAANPVGTFLLIGLGVESLSVSPAALTEIKKVIRSVDAGQAEHAAAQALAASTPADVVAALVEPLRDSLDLTLFSGSWNLSARD
jgi:phosphoenolpyruvate-protein phosphotransferase (PTS system enzyme I)